MGPWGPLFTLLPLLWLALIYRDTLITTPVICDSSRTNMTA